MCDFFTSTVRAGGLCSKRTIIGGLYWPSIYACLMACVIIPQFILLSIVILSGFTELIAAQVSNDICWLLVIGGFDSGRQLIFLLGLGQVAIVVLTLLTAFLIYRPHRNDAKTFPIFVAARIDASRAANKQLRSFEEVCANSAYILMHGHLPSCP